jgi:hypothetical protein
VAIAEVSPPRPIRWMLRLIHSPHAAWDRRGLADLLYLSGFTTVRTMKKGPVRSMVAIVTAER